MERGDDRLRVMEEENEDRDSRHGGERGGRLSGSVGGGEGVPTVDGQLHFGLGGECQVKGEVG
jgi:hypothetical protein